jgi:hypothetical protein
MPGFFHFLPHLTAARVRAANDRLDRDVLKARGLDDVLADVEVYGEHAILNDTHRGPGGQPGVVLYPVRADGELPDHLNYNPDVQTWTPVGGSRESRVKSQEREPERWIGWQTDAPPTPFDLERRRTFAGYTVEDASGRKWSVPIARSPADLLGSLPKTFDLDDDGQWRPVLAPDYQPIWDLSGEVWDWWNPPGVACPKCGQFQPDRGRDVPCHQCGHAPMPHDAQRDRFSDAWRIDAAVTVLSINYRVGRWEVAALLKAGAPLLDQLTVARILHCLIDGDIVDWAEKKTQPTTAGAGTPADESSSSSPGPRADCPAAR